MGEKVCVYGGGFLERIATRPAALGAAPQPPRRAPRPRPEPATFGGGDRVPQPPAEGGIVKMSDARRRELYEKDPALRRILAEEDAAKRHKAAAGRSAGPMTPERRAELLKLTPLGRAVLRDEAEAARKARG